MISLEQVRLLESKVKQAVDKIQNLNLENDELKLKLLGYEERIQELESLVNEFKASQDEIEEGFLKALSQLEEVEKTETAEAVTDVLNEEVQPEVQEESTDTVEESPEEEESAEIAVDYPREATDDEVQDEDTYSEEESSIEEQATEEAPEEQKPQVYHNEEPQNLEIF